MKKKKNIVPFFHCITKTRNSLESIQNIPMAAQVQIKHFSVQLGGRRCDKCVPVAIDITLSNQLKACDGKSGENRKSEIHI